MIRRAILDDAPRIAEIKVCGWRYAYRTILSDYELYANLEVVKNAKDIENKIRDGSTILVYEENGIIKAFSWYGLAEENEKRKDLEIYSLYVQPEFTGNNIGSELLRAIEKEAKILQRDRVVLWVLGKNDKGIRFYQRRGYNEDGMIKLITEWKVTQIRMIKDIK